MTHKKFNPPKDTVYVPLQVGSALNPDLGYMKDDTGDSISDLNPYYGENKDECNGSRSGFDSGIKPL